ncbi:unnamed protein product [Echinostoma caproni]|uniref:Uncharacterized protein n=1 Tax=Echinostoma caproni TaxID=27848 RepID=A0A183B8E7_9TREM|nr:unnamed protein product [Echinostoma caproni]
MSSTHDGQVISDAKITACVVAASKPLIGRQSLAATPLTTHDYYWPKGSVPVPNEQQQYHQRLNKLLERHQTKQLKHLRNDHPGSSASRAGRYSLGPTTSSSFLMPVCEVTRGQRDDNHARNFGATSRVHDSAYVDNRKIIPTACSPSKLARISIDACRTAPPNRHHPPTSDALVTTEPNLPRSVTRNTPSDNASGLLDDDDEQYLAKNHDGADAEDDVIPESEDPENHVANTSLGINSAMTGLALVTRTQSMGSQSSGDIGLVVTTPSPSVPSTRP